MKEKNIKERYVNAIESLKTRIKSNEEEAVILKIESIEDDYKDYNKKDIKNKMELGILVLMGLGALALGVATATYEEQSIAQAVAKYICSIGFYSIGGVSIVKSIVDYKKQKFNLNIDANENLKEYETFIDELEEKEKVNVKKR